MIAGETIASGAPSTCGDCFVKPPYEVLRSAAGYYIGNVCECGPYTRESGYYRNEVEAEAAIHLGSFSRD